MQNYDDQWECYRKERDPITKRFYRPEELTDVDKRIHRILHSLFKALEAKGGKVKQGERNELLVEFQGEEIEFNLREKLKQVHCPLTERERSYFWNDNKTTKYDLMPTGNLAFSIKTYLPNKLRREWVESANRPMEALLSEIMATILTSVPLLVERTKKRQEDERQRQIESQRRYEQEQRQKLENNRWRCFMEMANQWREAEIASSFIAAVKQLPVDGEQPAGDKTMAEWLAWAEEQLVARNPVNRGVEQIWDSVSEVTTWTYRDRQW